MMSMSPSLSSTFSRAGGADNDYNATIKRLAIEAHRWFEEALLDKVVGRDDNGGRGGQDKGRASVITNAQRRLLLMFHRCYPTRNPTCVHFIIATRCCQYWESISKETYISSYVT